MSNVLNKEAHKENVECSSKLIIAAPGTCAAVKAELIVLTLKT